MFKRTQEQHLISKLKDHSDRSVIIVQGARQTGKSTLIKSVLQNFSDKIVINLETELSVLAQIDQTQGFEEFIRFLKLKYNFKDQPGKVIFIDEAQESEKLGSYVRSFKESLLHTKVILSGSSMTRLFSDSQRIPVGRYSNILMTPLTFYEFLQASNKQALVEAIDNFNPNDSKSTIDQAYHQEFLKVLDRYLAVGGLPDVVKHYLNDQDWRRHRQEIYFSQEEDFVRKSGINDRSLFSDTMKAVANHLGFVSKYSHFSESSYMAKKIVGALQNWQLINSIPQRGIATTTKYFPKRYVYDLGIAQDLREHPFPTISIANTLNQVMRQPLGGLFENLLLNNLLAAQELLPNISGWKRHVDQDQEIDFIWKVADNKIIPIECKATTKIYKRHFNAMLEYFKITGLDKGLLVTAAPYQHTKHAQYSFLVLPIYLAAPQVIERWSSN